MLSLDQTLPTLGPRLQTIFDLIKEQQALNPFDCIWDCCCDHGYLGLQLLQHELTDQLFFVDQLPHIIERLHTKLESFPDNRYQTIVADAATLNFAADKHHLVILAGVGGEHIIDIIKAIELKHPQGNIDFIFCPATTQYNLREYLASQPFALAHESITSEKNRDYEVIHVKARASDQDNKSSVSLTGDMWDAKNTNHRRYLTKLITHYERQTKSSSPSRPQQILELYQERQKQLDLAV